MADNNIKTQEEYRLFIQRNGSKITEIYAKEAQDRVSSRTN
jgi:hypothetical protein